LSLNNRHKVVIITVAVGLVIWSIDAAVNSVLSPAGSSSGSGMPAGQPFFRLLFLIVLAASGMLVYRLIWRQAQMKALIVQAKKEWRRRLTSSMMR